MEQVRRRGHVFYTWTCKKGIACEYFRYDIYGSNRTWKGNVSVLSAWLGAFAYMFQIYFDFSGYSDMAVGLGKMFGFEFCMNF